MICTSIAPWEQRPASRWNPGWQVQSVDTSLDTSAVSDDFLDSHTAGHIPPQLGGAVRPEAGDLPWKWWRQRKCARLSDTGKSRSTNNNAPAVAGASVTAPYGLKPMGR